MFRLDDLIQPLITFGVSTIEYDRFNTSTVLPLSVVYVGKGSGWDDNRDVFFVPVSGIYYLSLTTMSYENVHHQVEIRVNKKPLVAFSLNKREQKYLRILTTTRFLFHCLLVI